MKKKNNKKPNIIYEPEANIFMWEINKQKIDYAKKIGAVIIHFSKNHAPVLIEVLEPSALLTQPLSLLEEEGIKATNTAIA